jgi:ERCC4-type nuclease
VERKGLETGDYSLADYEQAVSIERKSLADFVMCCTSERDRFMREMVRMKGMPHCAVIIEASIDDVMGHAYRSQVSPNAVMATALKLTTDWDIPVMWASNRHHAARCAAWMLRRWHGWMSKEVRP